MLGVLARRLGTGAVTLVLVTLLVLGLIHLAPGDPLTFEQELGFYRMSAETQRALRAQYHLDEPFHRQYTLWLGDLVRGDLGRSIHDRRPVTEKIYERLGITLTLNALALIAMVGLSIPIGSAAALHSGSRWDRGSAVGTYVLYAIPVFWSGLLLQELFAVHLGWLPPAGVRSSGSELLAAGTRAMDRAAHLVLPVICLTYGGLAYLSRFVRSTLLESVGGESWRAARARGLSAVAVLVRHGFRQAGIPMLTLAGFLLPGLVGGSVIVENIFAVPGLGRLFVDAAMQRDIPVLMGLTLFSGVATLAGILVADLAYLVVDPRMRRG